MKMFRKEKVENMKKSKSKEMDEAREKLMILHEKEMAEMKDKHAKEETELEEKFNEKLKELMEKCTSSKS